MYQTKFRGDDTKTHQIFGVTIGNEKITMKVQLHPAAPVINITKRHLIVAVWIVWHHPFTVSVTTGLYLPF